MNAVRSIVVGLLCLATGMVGAVPLYQCPLTVSGYAEGKAALADFPVLVRISTAIDQFDYGACAAGGADISFASEDGETVYPHEVDTWNPAGESLVWVKLPSMEHGTKFLFRWGDALPPANNPAAVWADYAGVWHLGEQEPGSYADSSSHGLTATDEVSATIAETCKAKAGKVGDGRWQPKLSLRIPRYDSQSVGGTFTASGWFYMDERTGYESFFNHKQAWNVGNGWQCNLQNSDTQIFVSGSEQKDSTACKFKSSVKGRWVYVAVAYSGTTVTLYENGTKLGDVAINAAKDNDRELVVGGSVRGAVDEIRICKAALSADWLTAENDMVGNSDYVSAGETELLSTEGIVVISDGMRYGAVSPSYGQIAEPVAGTTYDFSCTVATQMLNEAGTTRAVCTGWKLRRLSDGGLVKSSASEGESPFTCSHQYVQDEGVALMWRWQIQHLVTATAGDGGMASPAEQWVNAGETCAPITATADDGYAFFKWTGDVPSGSAGVNPLGLSVGAPLAVVANFGNGIYVSTDGSDQAAGTADAPFATLTNALASAKEGDVIYVLPGTHSAKASLVLNKPVTLIGISDAAGNRPTIDGANTYRTLKLTHADARVENLRIYRGYVQAASKSNNGGGGLNMSAGKVVNCEFADCYSAGEMPGGSVVMTGGTMSRCSVHGGYTVNNNGNGAGAYVNGSDALVEHCLFYDNSQASPRQGSDKKVGAVYLNAGTVRNCTIVNNNMGKAGGIYVASGAKFYDSIVWGNVAQNDTSEGAPNWQMASGAYVTNICTPVAMGVTTGERDLTAYPNFKDLAANDCRLMPGSPCIDAGSFAYPADALDLAGNPRTTGTATDLGAYELDVNEKAVGVAYSITGNLPGDILTFTAQTTGFGEEEIAAYWNFSDTYPTAEAHDAEGLEGSLELQAGVYSISLTVVCGSEEYHYRVKSGFTVYGMDLKVVDGNPNAKPPYDTWANAAANIADAVALATDGSVITLSNGTHKLTKPIDFLKAFTVQGLTGDPNDVTVDGGNKMLCADIKCAGAVIRDIRLYNGKHDNGGVVSLTANGRVDHCIVDTGYSGGNLHGGCIYMTAGTVSRSIVKNGHTTSGNGNGDGVYMNGADCVLEHSLIINNKSNWSTGKPGAGVYLSNGTVRNCTISGNTGSTAGGIWVGGNGKVIDTIVWGNTTLNDSSVGAPNFVISGSPKITNCWSKVQFGVTVGDFTLYGDPAFVDAANGDYTLGASSGCKDAAWGVPTVELDLAGSNRVQGAAMDLGCYEADPDVFSVDFGFTQAGTVDSATNVFTLIVTPEGTDLSNTQAYWTFDGRIPTAEDHDATGICVSNVFGAGGYDVAMLVVRDGVALDPIVKENLFKVYASLVCLDAANTEGAAKPWNTWANAATNVNEIVPYLTDDSLVLVKPGTYPVKSTIDLLSKITFRGVAGDGVSAPAVAERPVFLKSGNGTIRCFRIGKKGARVEHLSIKGFNYAGVGGDDSGGAVRISAGTLADCTIRDSTAGGNTPGGGVAVSGADSLATRCIVTNCATASSSAGYQGGGVHVSGGGRVENCLIIGCRSNGAGGAYVGQDGTLINCVVTNCSAVVQSGALNTTYPGGVSAGSATAAGGTVANCAIYGNKSGVAGVGGQVWGKSESLFRNNALAYVYGSNCVTNDPCFADALHGDWHLKVRSPLINAGVNLGYTAESKDFEGNPRIFKFGLKSSKPDIGLYETPWGTPGLLLQVK